MENQEGVKKFSVVLGLDAGRMLLDSNNIKQLYFIEDIFSFSVVGKLIFTDDRGIFEFGPLTGNETLTIIYGEDETIEKSFYIYKLSSVNQLSQTNPENDNVIELFFVDNTFYPLNFIQFSKAWKDEKTSDIIKDISTEWLNIEKWEKWENSNEVLKYYYSPYWTPKTNISWLLKRSSGNNYKTSGYLFYNTIQGSNFITFESLLNNKKLLKISKDDDGLYYFQDYNLFSYNKILSWNMTGLDSIGLKSVAGGTRFGFDSDSKQFLKQQYTYKESVKKNTILGLKTLFPDYSESKVDNKNLGDNNIKTIDNIFNNNWVRKYNLQQCISIIVRGHENRKPGELIEIKWKSKNPNEIYNKNLSGYYLIKSITHTLSGYNKPIYTQKMVLIKNGYEDSYAKNLLKSSKKRIV